MLTITNMTTVRNFGVGKLNVVRLITSVKHTGMVQ